jgi:DNA-binding transcriptional LysR family regulator
MKWIDRIGCRLKLHDLHIFMTVAETGSMGKAAERLALSQPSVSKAIATMEHEIGVRLLNRTPQGVETTAFGRALLRRGSEAFDELNRGIKDIEFLSNPMAGEVRVGCPEAFASGLLTEVLANFSRQYPRVIVRVYPANNMSREFRLLRDRNVDFLLGAIANPLMEEDLDVEVLYDDRPFIVAGRKNRWADRRKVDLAELVDEPWLLPLESIFSSVLAEAFQSRGLDVPKRGVRSYCVYQRLSLLASNHFVASLPGSVLRFNVDQFSLKVLPVDFLTRPFQVAVVTLKNRTLSPVVHSFIDCVRDVTRPLARVNLRPSSESSDAELRPRTATQMAGKQ